MQVRPVRTKDEENARFVIQVLNEDAHVEDYWKPERRIANRGKMREVPRDSQRRGLASERSHSNSDTLHVLSAPERSRTSHKELGKAQKMNNTDSHNAAQNPSAGAESGVSKDEDHPLTTDAALASLAGAGLSAPALGHHDTRESYDDTKPRRKIKSSRSRSEEITESVEKDRHKSFVPRLPLLSGELQGSDMTRESILSAETEIMGRPASRSSRGPGSPSPSRTPDSRRGNLKIAHNVRSAATQEERDAPKVPTIQLEPVTRSTAKTTGNARTQIGKNRTSSGRQRSRSSSKERITQRVIEKLEQKPVESATTTTNAGNVKTSREELTPDRKSRRRTSRSSYERLSESRGTGSSLLSPNAHRGSGGVGSARSAVSGTSSTNNPKLLATVEDSIRRLILPELTALKEEQRTQKNRAKFRDPSSNSYETVVSGTRDRALTSSNETKPRRSSHGYETIGWKTRDSPVTSSNEIKARDLVHLPVYESLPVLVEKIPILLSMILNHNHPPHHRDLLVHLCRLPQI